MAASAVKIMQFVTKEEREKIPDFLNPELLISPAKSSFQ